MPDYSVFAGSPSIVEIAEVHFRARSRWPASGVCLLGIAIAALAGLTKEREMPEEQKKKIHQGIQFQEGHRWSRLFPAS